MKPQGFPKSLHLRRGVEFSRVYNSRQRAGDGYLLVFGAANGLEVTRIGLSVSRKHGGAVQRNRIKRLLREAFRRQSADLPQGLDLVLIPRVGSGAGLEDYQRSLSRLIRKLARQFLHEGRT